MIGIKYLIKNKYYLLLLISIVWFYSRVGTLVVTLAPGIAPDEIHHIQYVDLYGKSTKLFPINNSWSTIPKPLQEYEKFSLGVEAPYLYHLILGNIIRFLKLNTFDFDTIVFLRLINTFLSLICIFIFYNILNELKLIEIIKFSGLIFITNNPTFTVLSSSVNYDLAIYLLCWAALYFIIIFFKDPTLNYFLCILSLLLVASLVKMSALPIIFIFCIFLIYKLVKRKILFKKIFFNQNNITHILIFLILLILNLELYGGNLYQYGKLLPSCDQVFEKGDCYSYNNSNYDIVRLENLNKKRDNIFIYSFKWGRKMTSTILGIKAQRSIYLPKEAVDIFYIIFLVSISMFVIKLRFFNDFLVVGMVIIYSMFLIVFLNYTTHIDLGDYSVGVNGRYIYPVLPFLVYMFLKGYTFIFRSHRILNTFYSLLCLTFIFIQSKILFYSDSYKWFISGPSKKFYKIVGYGNAPIYDKEFNLIKN